MEPEVRALVAYAEYLGFRSEDLDDLVYDYVSENAANAANRVSDGETEGYRGNNYISLFWGDETPDAIRSLTAAELDEVNRLLEGLAGLNPPAT